MVNQVDHYFTSQMWRLSEILKAYPIHLLTEGTGIRWKETGIKKVDALVVRAKVAKRMSFQGESDRHKILCTQVN
jgi:hypothetical protein